MHHEDTEDTNHFLIGMSDQEIYGTTNEALSFCDRVINLGETDYADFSCTLEENPFYSDQLSENTNDDSHRMRLSSRPSLHIDGSSASSAFSDNLDALDKTVRLRLDQYLVNHPHLPHDYKVIKAHESAAYEARCAQTAETLRISKLNNQRKRSIEEVSRMISISQELGVNYEKNSDFAALYATQSLSDNARMLPSYEAEAQDPVNSLKELIAMWETSDCYDNWRYAAAAISNTLVCLLVVQRSLLLKTYDNVPFTDVCYPAIIRSLKEAGSAKQLAFQSARHLEKPKQRDDKTDYFRCAVWLRQELSELLVEVEKLASFDFCYPDPVATDNHSSLEVDLTYEIGDVWNVTSLLLVTLQKIKNRRYII